MQLDILGGFAPQPRVRLSELQKSGTSRTSRLAIDNSQGIRCKRNVKPVVQQYLMNKCIESNSFVGGLHLTSYQLSPIDQLARKLLQEAQ